MAKGPRVRIDNARLAYEYPLLLPLIAAFHVGGRSVHEAMYYLARERVEPLREASKLARIYLSLFTRYWDVIQTLHRLTMYIRLAPLKSFLTSYAATLASRGGAVHVVERGLDTALEELRARMSSSIELVNVLSEAVILFSAITVFITGLFAANPAILLALYTVISIIGALLLVTRPRAVEVYLGKPSLTSYIMSGAANILVILALAFDMAARLSLQEHLYLVTASLLLVLAPIIELKHVLRKLRDTVMLGNALTEALQLGLDPISTLERLTKQSVAVEEKSKLSAVLRVKDRVPIEDYLEKMSLVLSRNGVRAARSARLLTNALEEVELRMRWLIKRSIVYDIVALVSMVILVATVDMLSNTMPLAAGGLQAGALEAPLPLQVLEPPPFLKPGLAVAIAAAVYFAGAALRGSIAYSVTPPIMLAAYIAVQLAVNSLLGAP